VLLKDLHTTIALENGRYVPFELWGINMIWTHSQKLLAQKIERSLTTFQFSQQYMYISFIFILKKLVWTPYWPINFKPTYSLLLLFQSFWNFVIDLQ
jgi:hypothetical protein